MDHQRVLNMNLSSILETYVKFLSFRIASKIKEKPRQAWDKIAIADAIKSTRKETGLFERIEIVRRTQNTNKSKENSTLPSELEY